MASIQFTLSYTGAESDDNEIDLYDVSQALEGFQRSLALTTHLVLNDEIITQSPSLKGARILALPPQEGSWKINAAVGIIATGIYTVGTAPKDTALGNLIASAYDYVISETLGFHVDFNKTLGIQLEEMKEKSRNEKPPTRERFDSLIEKCEPAIRTMHRPIVESETATKATILYNLGTGAQPIHQPLTRSTFEYMRYTHKSDVPVEITGKVSSYNINTFKGRIYVAEEQRPIPFELGDIARDPTSVGIIARSLSTNATERFEAAGNITFRAFRNESRTGRLKGYFIVEVLG